MLFSYDEWPGGHNIATTPRMWRRILEQWGDTIGLNFDPSHLIRMGIDPVRFIDEFAPRVVHVHGKDTEILEDDLYELGNLQPATFAKGHGFGGHHWRYTIPGHGVARWNEIIRRLVEKGYHGAISIELEDANFHQKTELEQLGIVMGAKFLTSV